MKNKWKIRAWAVSMTIGCFLTWGSARAHHSDAEFNLEELVTLELTVTRVDYVNPHMVIHFDEKAETEGWIAYGGPPNRMARVGWTSQTVKPGEHLTVTGFPSKYGKKTMLFVKLVRANGEVIPLPETLTGFATRRGLKP